MNEVVATVQILDRSYSLRIPSEEVSLLQSAAGALDELARNFGTQFPKKDSQDYIAMAAIMRSLQLGRQEQHTHSSCNDDDELRNRLSALDALLDQAFPHSQDAEAKLT